jgi:hypothetical protein
MTDSILVVTTCTKRKAPGPRGGAVPAECLYVGEQHRRLMVGVRYYRSAPTHRQLELKILSAGHGVLPASRRLVPYERTFSGLPGAEIERRARTLAIPTQARTLLAKPRALILLLLSADYLRAAELNDATPLGGPAIVFGGASAAKRFGSHGSLALVRPSAEQAQRFSCGLVGLKGELAARLLVLLARRPRLLTHLPGETELLELLAASPLPSTR